MLNEGVGLLLEGILCCLKLHALCVFVKRGHTFSDIKHTVRHVNMAENRDLSGAVQLMKHFIQYE